MLRKLALLILFAAPIPVLARICPASDAVGFTGIGDGCTTMGLEYIPNIGIFKSTFTPACDAHDKCYTRLGAVYDSCDSAFYEDMRARCNSKFIEWLQPVEWALCRATAFEYYEGVKWWRHEHPENAPAFQNDARNRSIDMHWKIHNGECGTTPERTTLYAPQLISQVYGAWSTYARRPPTLYEFLDVVNAGNMVTDPAGWTSILYTRASIAAGVTPPPVGWYKTSPGEYGVSFFAYPVTPGVSYYWKIPDIGNGPSLTRSFWPPMFNVKVNVRRLFARHQLRGSAQHGARGNFDRAAGYLRAQQRPLGELPVGHCLCQKKGAPQGAPNSQGMSISASAACSCRRCSRPPSGRLPGSPWCRSDSECRRIRGSTPWCSASCQKPVNGRATSAFGAMPFH